MSPLNTFVEFEKTVIPDKVKYELQAFSVYRSISDIFKDDIEKLDIKDEIYYYRRWITMVNNSKKQKRLTWIVNNIKRIGELLQNKEFDRNDLTLTFLFVYYYHKNINLTDIKTPLVKYVIEKFSDKQYEKDKQFVLEICKEVKINSIEDFFKITEDGTNLVYKYCIDKQFISPLFYINLVGKVPTQNEQNANINYKKFNKISQLIRDLLTNDN